MLTVLNPSIRVADGSANLAHVVANHFVGGFVQSGVNQDARPGLELYELPGCPYCAKVRRALDDLDLEYESYEVPRSRRDRTAVYEVSDQYGVPVLVDEANGIEGMAESDDVVAYLYREYGDGEEPPPSGLVSGLLARLF